MGGKEAVENPFAERCEPIQVILLNLFGSTLNTYNDLLMVSVAKVVIQSDHMAGDTGEFMRQQALASAIGYTESAMELVAIMKSEGSDGLTKDTYYKALFHIRESLLPSVRTIEQVFGDNAPQVDGVMYSSAVESFITEVA